MSLRVHPGFLAIVGATAEPEDSDELASMPVTEEASIIRIRELMEDERYNAKDEITLNILSQQMNLPVYKLRTVINQGMGFRNFNQFLNSYRIVEASERLIRDRKLPILTIALDIGFRSLSAFNKAFKDTHHVTPTELRLQSKSLQSKSATD